MQSLWQSGRTVQPEPPRQLEIEDEFMSEDSYSSSEEESIGHIIEKPQSIPVMEHHQEPKPAFNHEMNNIVEESKREIENMLKPSDNILSSDTEKDESEDEL